MFLLSEWGSRKFDKYGAVLKRWWWHREMSLGNIGENKSAQKEIQIKYLGKSAFPMDKNIACTAQHSYQKIIYQISYFMNIRLYIIFNDLIDFFILKQVFFYISFQFSVLFQLPWTNFSDFPMLMNDKELRWFQVRKCANQKTCCIIKAKQAHMTQSQML